jgi:hypothetical protein
MITRISDCVPVLLDQWPGYPDAIIRLAEFLKIEARQPGFHELSVKQLQQESDPIPLPALARILAYLTQEGILVHNIIVTSNSGVRLGSYASLLDVPLDIFDPEVGGYVRTLLAHVQAVYILRHQGQTSSSSVAALSTTADS